MHYWFVFSFGIFPSLKGRGESVLIMCWYKQIKEAEKADASLSLRVTESYERPFFFLIKQNAVNEYSLTYLYLNRNDTLIS